MILILLMIPDATAFLLSVSDFRKDNTFRESEDIEQVSKCSVALVVVVVKKVETHHDDLGLSSSE